MTAAREEILHRIRTIERASAPPPARAYSRLGTLGVEARVNLFCERVADYRATVVRTNEVMPTITSICSTHAARRFGVPPGLPAAWRPKDIDLIEDDELPVTTLDALDGAITGCTAGVAETGTLVLTAGESEGRRALTLVPDLHICVIYESQIVETIPEAIALLERASRPITLISGPSATSDIELSRVEGVHGPRTLVVVVASEPER